MVISQYLQLWRSSIIISQTSLSIYLCSHLGHFFSCFLCLRLLCLSSTPWKPHPQYSDAPSPTSPDVDFSGPSKPSRAETWFIGFLTNPNKMNITTKTKTIYTRFRITYILYLYIFFTIILYMYILLFLFIAILIIYYYPHHKFIPINLNQLNLQNTTSLFWTGGYDSTFRLCQLLIDEKKKVQPIYVACHYIDSTKKDYFADRSSKNKEIKIMQKIRRKLFNDFPYTRHLLKPLLIIYKVRDDPIADKKTLYIHYQLGKYARPYTQYERISRFSLYYPTNIEVGLDKCGTGLDKATQGFREGIGANCKIWENLPEKYRALDVYKKIRFGIVHLTKKDMLKISENNGYKYILKMTWSCWFPKKIYFFRDGSPCGKCEMCKKRVLQQGQN